jgi:predicted Zn-ribbon and HTH transcriptional regulator
MKSINNNFYKYPEQVNIMAKVKITVDGFLCERCRHKWVPKKEDLPLVCPKCKSPYWNKPRKKVKKNGK